MAIPKASVDELLKYVVPAITNYRTSQASQKTHTFTLGVTGLQGSGKSTWATTIANRLRCEHNYKVITVSLDDFYHDHDSLVKLRDLDTSNKLFRTRGQPGSHDTQLAQNFFRQLHKTTNNSEPLGVPSFDKSRFNGEGDRLPVEDWEQVSLSPPPDVLVFEGWCVGFQPLSEQEVKTKWHDAKQRSESSPVQNELEYTTITLPRHALEHLLRVNKYLEEYCNTFMGPNNFDFFIHLDTNDLVNVYRWRIGQEEALRESKGKGMSDDDVIRFVQGYMPSYELYLDHLRHGPFVEERRWNHGNKNHLRLILDQERVVTQYQEV